MLNQYSASPEQITEVYEAHAIAFRQQQACLKMKCNQARIRELEDHAKVLENLLNSLLIANPVLVSEDLFKKIDENQPLDIKSYLAANLAEGFRRDAQIASKLSQMKSMYLRDSSTYHQLFSEAFKYSGALDLVLSNSFSHWDQRGQGARQSLCDIALIRKKQKQINEGIDSGFKSTMVVLSLLPAFNTLKAGAFGVSSALSGLSLVGRGGGTAAIYNDLQSQKDECSNNASLFLEEISLAFYSQWKECHEQVDYLELSMVLSALPVELISLMPKTFSKIGIASGFKVGPHYVANNQMRLNQVFGSRVADFSSNLSTKERVSCMDLEFVFLASLFMGMDFANGKPTSRLFDFKEKKVLRKLRIVLEKGQEEVVWGQLEPSLLGASRGFLKNTCRLNKNLWEMLISEANFFNLKDAEGKQFSIEDFVELHYWNEDSAITIDEGVFVKKEDLFGNFTVVFQDKDDVLVPYIDFDDEDIEPVWEVPQSLKPFSFSDSSIIPLGTSSPFSLDAPPTSYWLKLGERESYLIDCGFFSDIVLERNGGSINNLKGIILTHCHGDHFNPIPFLYRSKPIELWTTIENYKLAQRITCAKAGISPEEFQKRFLFQQVEAMYPGKDPQRYPFGFLDIEFHYSIHPIPTIGLTIYKEDEKLVVFSSDMVDLDFMEKTLLENDIIQRDRYDMFMERFQQTGFEKTLFLLDCGGDGFIHGKAGGYSKFFHDTTKVVECHRGARKPGEDVFMQLAQPLNLYKISDYNLDVRLTSLLAQYLNQNGLQYFVDAVSYLKESLEVIEYAADQPVIIEGSKVKNEVYLIDYGKVVSTGGLYFESGHSFGEESLFDSTVYPWSYRTYSPVRLIVLRSDLLKRILSDQIVLELKRKYQWRQALACAKLFANLELSVELIDELQLKLKVKKFGSDEIIYQKGQEDDGHLYLIHSGKLMVELAKDSEIIVGKNDIVGEAVASGKGQRRNATVRTQGQVELIRMERETFKMLMTNMKILQRVREINAERAA